LGENGGTGFDVYHAAKIGVRVISNTQISVTTIRVDNKDRIDPGAFFIAVLYK
jgi:hypothetical protein